MFINWNRRYRNISPKQPTYKNRHMQHLRICSRTINYFHQTMKYNIWQISDHQRKTRTKRITQNFLQQTQRVRSKSSIRSSGIKFKKQLFHRKNEQHSNTNGTPIGDENTSTSLKLCTGTRTRSTESKRNIKRKQLQLEHHNSTFSTPKNKTRHPSYTKHKTAPTMLEMRRIIHT